MTTPDNSDSKRGRSTRAILLTLSVVSLFVAGLLFLRAYFIELRNNPNSELVSGELPGQDSRREINGVDTELGGNNQVWGDELENIYQLPSSNPWIAVKETGVTTVGEIANSKFTPKFTIPAVAEHLWVYQNYYLSYTTPSTNVDLAKLWLMDRDQKTESVVSLPAGWDFSGVTFNILDRSFYYARTNSRGKVAVERVVPGQQPVQLFVASTNQLTLVAVPTKTTVELIDRSNEECVVLNTSDKTLKPKNCSSLHWAVDQYNYGFTKFEITEYDPESVYRLYKVEVGKTKAETVLKAKAGEVFTLGSKFGNQVAYLVMDVSVNESDLVDVAADRIELLKLGSAGAETVAIDELGHLIKIQVWGKGIITAVTTVDSKVELSIHLPQAASEVWTSVDIPACEIGCEIEFINMEKLLYETT